MNFLVTGFLGNLKCILVFIFFLFFGAITPSRESREIISIEFFVRNYSNVFVLSNVKYFFFQQFLNLPWNCVIRQFLSESILMVSYLKQKLKTKLPKFVKLDVIPKKKKKHSINESVYVAKKNCLAYLMELLFVDFFFFLNSICLIFLRCVATWLFTVNSLNA